MKTIVPMKPRPWDLATDINSETAYKYLNETDDHGVDFAIVSDCIVYRENNTVCQVRPKFLFEKFSAKHYESAVRFFLQIVKQNRFNNLATELLNEIIHYSCIPGYRELTLSESLEEICDAMNKANPNECAITIEDLLPWVKAASEKAGLTFLTDWPNIVSTKPRNNTVETIFADERSEEKTLYFRIKLTTLRPDKNEGDNYKEV